MHELSISENIIRITREELKRRGISKPVTKIAFQAGRLSAIIPDSLRFHFDLVKKDEPQLERAELEIREIPLRAKCDQCGRETELEEPIFICTECGGSMKLIGGQEMFIESFSVEEDPQDGS